MGSCFALLLSSSKEPVSWDNKLESMQIFKLFLISLKCNVSYTYSLHDIWSCACWLKLEMNDLVRYIKTLGVPATGQL